MITYPNLGHLLSPLLLNTPQETNQLNHIFFQTWMDGWLETLSGLSDSKVDISTQLLYEQFKNLFLVIDRINDVNCLLYRYPIITSSAHSIHSTH